MSDRRPSIPGTLKKEMSGLVREIGRCEALARDPARRAACAASVSGWSVADHLEHLLLADRRILSWLETAAGGTATTDRGGPSVTGLLVLLTGAIPRGRGQAPDGTRPEGVPPDALADGWSELLERVRTLRARTEELRASRARSMHPVLGSFGTWQWTRFARVHHGHHGAIIRQILVRAGDG